jgi:nucleotide-binding universal stress UspA family protein
MKLLVAFDREDHTVLALDKAIEVAVAEEADVTVLSVVPPSARGSKSGGHMDLPPHADKDVAYAEKYLGDRGVQAETKVAQGHPADEILQEARAGDYDVIVVGTRELGPVVGLLLGSVSRKVVHDAPCPVIVAGKSGSKRMEPKAITPA